MTLPAIQGRDMHAERQQQQLPGRRDAATAGHTLHRRTVGERGTKWSWHSIKSKNTYSVGGTHRGTSAKITETAATRQLCSIKASLAATTCSSATTHISFWQLLRNKLISCVVRLLRSRRSAQPKPIPAKTVLQTFSIPGCDHLAATALLKC